MISRILPILFLILNVVCSFVTGETGCPPAEDIEPCKCTRHPTPRLICTDLESADELNAVFTNSERYTYQEVHIINSLLLAFPDNIFDKTTVRELYLRNSTVRTLFPKSLRENQDLYKIHIERTIAFNSITAGNFSTFPNLKELSVYFSSVSSIPSKFGELLPNSIKKVIFHGTNIKKIAPGALTQHPNLYKFAVESSSLKKLSRDIFPQPFNGNILNFDDNKISTIPEDLFTDMPNLQFLSMMNNAISVIPEAAFTGRSKNIPYFRFEGNPLQCDCELLWIIKDKSEIIGGTCSTPEKLSGRHIKDLVPAELSC